MFKKMFALQKGTEYRLTVEMFYLGISWIPCPSDWNSILEWHEVFGDFTFESIKEIIKDQIYQFMPSRDPSDNSIIQYFLQI